MAELSGDAGFDRYLVQGPGPFPIALPQRPLRSAPIDGGTALWLGPAEWLLLMEAGRSVAIASASGSVVDISHRNVGFRLSGEDAALLLNGAVPLDLAVTAFPIGMCTRTVFEKAEIVLWRVSEATWQIDVARSLAPYVRELLATIAAANGIPLQAG